MKPLNRPMFKYGGPIKEGIMNGMKDNTGTGLVGDKRYPKTDGRSHHFAVLPFIGMNALRTGAMRMAPRIASYFRTQVGTKTVPRPGPTFIDKGTFVPAKNVRIPSSGTYGGVKFQPGKNIGTGTMEVPVMGNTKLGSYFASDPIFRTGAAIVKGVTNPASKGAIQKGARFVFSPSGILTGAYFAGGKFFNSDGTEIKNPEEKGLTPGGEMTTGTTKPGESGGTTVVSEEKLEQMNKDRIQKNKERYYKLMGLDNMKKDAVYDSLIDASKIIQEEGADLKGSIKSGTLQNRIIQAISGQLDKSAALKRQIDAAVLKGEIEKDIKANDPSAKLDAEYKKAAIKKMEAADGTLLSDIRSFVDKYQTLPSGTALAGLAKTRGMDIVKIADTQEVTDWVSKNGGDEEDFIKAMIQDPENEVASGVHVVNNALVEVGADGSVTKLF